MVNRASERHGTTSSGLQNVQGRTHGKAGGPSEVADCGAGWAKLQLASKAAAGGPGDRAYIPGFQPREIKPQTTD